MSRARIIKGGRARAAAPPRSVARLISAREQELEARCAARLAQAEQEAAELLSVARRQAEAIGEAELSQARREAVELLVEARRSAEALVEQARGDLTQLAIGIAEKIIGAELALAPERVVEVVAQVLRAAGPSGRLLARVHPLDLPLLEARFEQLAQAAGEGALELGADATVSRGGCVLETDRGVADGRIEVQLATLQQVLFADSESECSGPLGEAATDTDLDGEGLSEDTVVGLTAVATAVSSGGLASRRPDSAPLITEDELDRGERGDGEHE